MIQIDHNYDEAKEIEVPNLETVDPKWKDARIFVQTRSKVRELQPGTLFLYCKLCVYDYFFITVIIFIITIIQCHVNIYIYRDREALTHDSYCICYMSCIYTI